MDFLNKWITRLTREGLLQPPFLECRTCLLYADDTLLLLKPEQQQLRFIKMVLDEFGRLYGLTINLEKSQLLLNTGQEEETQKLSHIIGCSATTFPFMYLGLPPSNKKFSIADYEQLVQKITNRLPGWKGSLLSISGRLILVQTV
jgi:Reverse transcriptase (RNA-dependent DNA polymerase)